MKMITACSVLIIVAIVGCARADLCLDDDGDFLYCNDGCCGWNNDYCCEDTWGAGSIAGTVVGMSFFCFFVVLIVVCCRRRRRLSALAYVRNQQPNPGVTVVQSSQHMNSVAANVAPVYSQYPAQGQMPPGYPPPAYPTGTAQPPPYYAK